MLNKRWHTHGFQNSLRQYYVRDTSTRDNPILTNEKPAKTQATYVCDFFNSFYRLLLLLLRYSVFKYNYNFLFVHAISFWHLFYVIYRALFHILCHPLLLFFFSVRAFSLSLSISLFFAFGSLYFLLNRVCSIIFNRCARAMVCVFFVCPQIATPYHLLHKKKTKKHDRTGNVLRGCKNTTQQNLFSVFVNKNYGQYWIVWRCRLYGQKGISIENLSTVNIFAYIHI